MPERFLHLDRPVSLDIAAIESVAENLRHGSAVSSVTAESFGEKLKKAIERKQSPRHAATAAFAAAPRKNDDEDDDEDEKNGDKDADNESFGKRIKRAVQRKSRALKTQKQHQELAERERRRYQQPRPRQRTEDDE